MPRPLARSLTALALTFGVLADAASEPDVPREAVRVRGTSVRLTPPEGFVPAERFPGFQNEELRASIQVTVLAGPVAETKKGMTQESLAKHGMTLLTSSNEKVNGGEATVVHVVQRAGDSAYAKCLVTAGDEKATVLLVASVPQDAEAKHLLAMRAAMLGATWDAAAPADLYEGLPFRLTPPGTLTEVKRAGHNLLLTEPGRPKARGPRDPLCIVGTSHSAVAIGDLAAFSRARIAQTATLKGTANLRGAPVQVAGLGAYELLADALDAESGTPMIVYQVIVPDGTGYWMVVGIVAQERAEEFLPVFRKLTESIRRAPTEEALAAKPALPSEPPPDPNPAR